MLGKQMHKLALFLNTQKRFVTLQQFVANLSQ